MLIAVIFNKSDKAIKFFIENVQSHSETDIVGVDSSLRGIDSTVLDYDIVECDEITGGTSSADAARMYLIGGSFYRRGYTYAVNVDSQLDRIKQDKIASLNKQCGLKILTEGMTSSALGEPHQYSTDKEAQDNLTGMVSLMNAKPDLVIKWKTYDSGDLPHDKDQIVQLAMDMFTHINTNIYHYRNLRDQVLKCTTREKVDLITWDSPLTK